MIRGEIRDVGFEPVRGSEAAKHRRAVIVSNDGANTTAVALDPAAHFVRTDLVLFYVLAGRDGEALASARRVLESGA